MRSYKKKSYLKKTKRSKRSKRISKGAGRKRKKRRNTNTKLVRDPEIELLRDNPYHLNKKELLKADNLFQNILQRRIDKAIKQAKKEEDLEKEDKSLNKRLQILKESQNDRSAKQYEHFKSLRNTRKIDKYGMPPTPSH